MRLSEILERLLLGDYEAAKEGAMNPIIAHHTRGNTSVQYTRGNVSVQYIGKDDSGNLYDAKLGDERSHAEEFRDEKLCDAGDKAIKRISDWPPKIISNNVISLENQRSSASNSVLEEQINFVSKAWIELIRGQLNDLGIEAKKEGSEFNSESSLHAAQFIRDLPMDIEQPTLGLEDQGNILIEWYKRDRGEDATIFSVVLGAENYVYSLLKDGLADTHGVLNYSAGSLEVILTFLRNNFGTSSNARLRA